ncbi:cysteine dioxygenase family protein [Virgibacillus sp. SK37]|uniref:cysteine dioxygenase family protein n=1 Tax=Virgibacillus sp. SK37 TaxID=403957 RepID=UPI0004D1AB08|nr:cysteine dioxygenase family protein [Virgibacillus sp. SK37]AIF44304.1 cysteine dioxygenase [Virgibacillus sp. SK37]
MASLKTYSLKEFVQDMTRLVEDNIEEATLVNSTEGLVGELIKTNDWLPNSVYQVNENGYTRHSLYRDPENRFEVLALGWKAGQKTPLHDHDGTWGVEGVVTGMMKVKNFVRNEEEEGEYVKLIPAGTVRLNEHSTGELLPPADCHILESVGEKMAVTIHVYGKQLTKFRLFQLQNDRTYKVKWVKVGYTKEY